MFYLLFYCQALYPFCVHVYKRSKKWTQSDTLVFFHPPTRKLSLVSNERNAQNQTFFTLVPLHCIDFSSIERYCQLSNLLCCFYTMRNVKKVSHYKNYLLKLCQNINISSVWYTQRQVTDKDKITVLTYITLCCCRKKWNKNEFKGLITGLSPKMEMPLASGDPVLYKEAQILPQWSLSTVCSSV